MSEPAGRGQHGPEYNARTKAPGHVTASFAYHLVLPHAPPVVFTDAEHRESVLHPERRVCAANVYMRHGQLFEPEALRALAAEWRPRRARTDEFYKVDGSPYLTASPDALFEMADGSRLNVEIKAPKRTPAVPPAAHLVQTQLQMRATGTQRTLYACLVRGAGRRGALTVWEIAYDPALADAIVAALLEASRVAREERRVWTPEDVERWSVMGRISGGAMPRRVLRRTVLLDAAALRAHDEELDAAFGRRIVDEAGLGPR